MSIIKTLNHIFILFVILLSTGEASTYPLPTNGDNVIGDIQTYFSQNGDDLEKIGRNFDIGAYEMIDANPNIDAKHKLTRGTVVKLPRRFILPGNIRKGIVVNLSELRLYYYLEDEKSVLTEPIGIGRVGWKTPIGVTKIIEKKVNPPWRPSAAVRKEAERLGLKLPDILPPGPDNPLGHHMMRLGWYSYLIHGTNRPDGVGKRVTAGCIRMYPEDIEALFPLVPVGTVVTIVDLPIKVGRHNDKLLVEIHKPLEERGQIAEADTIDLIEMMTELIENKPVTVRWKYALDAVKRQSGIPTIVGKYHTENSSVTT